MAETLTIERGEAQAELPPEAVVAMSGLSAASYHREGFTVPLATELQGMGYGLDILADKDGTSHGPRPSGPSGPVSPYPTPTPAPAPTPPPSGPPSPDR